MNINSLGVSLRCVCARCMGVGIHRQTSGDVMVLAGYKPTLKKQRRSRLNQCYGWFMDCTHPIRALIKQEQCENGESVASNSPQDYFCCLLEPKDFALCGCCSAMLTWLLYYEQIQFFPAPSLLKRVSVRRTQEAVHSISFPFEKQCSGNDKCVRPIEKPSGQ